jgi:hypothetical protein
LRHIAWKIEVVTEDNYSSHTYYERRNAGIDNIPYAHYVIVSNPTQGKEYYYQIEKDKTES